MSVAHMHQPDFRVLSDFPKTHRDFLRSCFVQSAKLAMELGLVRLGHVALDGSKIVGNTSKHKAMSYGRMEQLERALGQEIETLLEPARRCDEGEDAELGEASGYEIPQELELKEKRQQKIREAQAALERREKEAHGQEPIHPRKQISFADKDAQIMSHRGHFEYAYNAQISVDEAHQIIVGQHVSTACNDVQELGEALEQVEATTGRLPEKLSADSGYLSGSNLEKLEEAQVDGYVALGREGKKRRAQGMDKSQFVYDEANDCFVCPAGHPMACFRVDKDGTRFYQADIHWCRPCEHRSRCCRSRRGAPRTLRIGPYENLRRKMASKMQDPQAQSLYRRRKAIVEPVFGHIKNLGFRRFLLRGLAKVRGEFASHVRGAQHPEDRSGGFGWCGQPWNGKSEGRGRLRGRLAPFLGSSQPL
ncbi:IS1182 family transposase [Desulfosoma sp.]|uniref:IS1182 family transposase n=1 Tax=Desulfosoma sp. TaxID=2603217 RepID=UPI004049F0E4